MYDFLIYHQLKFIHLIKIYNYPEYINDKQMDTYHRWLEVFIMSSLFDLPTITVPVGFNKNRLPMGMQIIAKKGRSKVNCICKKIRRNFQF